MFELEERGLRYNAESLLSWTNVPSGTKRIDDDDDDF